MINRYKNTVTKVGQLLSLVTNQRISKMAIIAGLIMPFCSHAQLSNKGQMFVDSSVVIFAAGEFQNEASANITNKGTVQTAGSLINNSLITGPGKVVLSGTTNQQISGLGTISSLEVNNTAGATVATNNRQSIEDVLSITSGTLNANNGITLLSTATNTARVAPVPTGSITGDVNVERYFANKRAWRLVTAPVTNANTILEAWQNSKTFIPNRGLFITGPGGTNGLDNGQNFSLKSYNVSNQQLENVTSTNTSLSGTTGSSDNRGYFLFVRGDRSPSNLTPPNSTTTTISSRGTIQTGPQNFIASATANNFTLIGNPYASPVDFNAITRNNVAKRFYAWDPQLNTVGGYVLLDDMDEDGVYTVTPSSAINNILQSGQAVFVQTAAQGAASVTFEEADKTEVVSNAAFRNNRTPEAFSVNLFLKNGTDEVLADGVMQEFDVNYSPAITIHDGLKMQNIHENLSIKKEGQYLSLERRPSISATDTIKLQLTNTTKRSYSLEFNPTSLSSVSEAWLIDKLEKTPTALSTTTSSSYAFAVTTDPATAAVDRFSIVFKPATTLAAEALQIKGLQQANSILIQWTNLAEKGVSDYILEASENGKDFIAVTTVSPKENNSSEQNYNYADKKFRNGNNYYRVKMMFKNGSVKYSRIINIKTSKGEGEIFVYPVPVTNNNINLQFTNQPKDTYTVRLINALGQQVFQRKIEHAGGSLNRALSLPGIARGVYEMQILGKESKLIKKIIIE